MKARSRRVIFAATFMLVLSGVPLQPASAARTCAYFEFDKGTNINSTLIGRAFDQSGRCVVTRSWRAGSGLNTNPCDKDNGDGVGGWLPNGWYDVLEMNHSWNGSAVRGRVWRLENKACSDGTFRTELFIHTEETASATQECTPPANDSPWCWDDYQNGSGTNDYYSACIKVRRQSPEGNWANDHGPVHQFWHDFGGQHGARTDSVHVHA
jgi:hypothetical protein